MSCLTLPILLGILTLPPPSLKPLSFNRSILEPRIKFKINLTAADYIDQHIAFLFFNLFRSRCIKFCKIFGKSSLNVLSLFAFLSVATILSILSLCAYSLYRFLPPHILMWINLFRDIYHLIGGNEHLEHRPEL